MSPSTRPSSPSGTSSCAAETSRTCAELCPQAAAKAPQAAGAPQTTLHESFTIGFPRAQVWEFFGRPDEVATCLPGTSLTGTPTADHVETRMRVRAGPIVAEFDGAADVGSIEVR